MLLYSPTPHIPAFFRIEPGIIDRVGKVLTEEGCEFETIGIVSGSHFSKEIAQRVICSFSRHANLHRFTVLNASEQTVSDLHRYCQEKGVRLVISIGGGSVIDVCKRLHRLYNIPSIVVPTIISNDGLISPIAVLSTGAIRESLPALPPLGVIVDLDIIRTAPREYLVAGAGDVLSNLSASEDWRRVSRQVHTAEPFNDLAFHLAFGSAESLIHMPNADFDDDVFLINLIRCQIYSGLAMSIAGSSRPCSGSEHLISHAIDHLGYGPYLLHGVQVGSASLFTMYLLGMDTSVAISFARKIGLPLDWRMLSPAISANVSTIVSTARRVRPGRRTILDRYEDEEIIEHSEEFGAFLTCH